MARCTVELVMRRNGLAGLPGRPRWRKIPNQRTACDLVDRRFYRDGPDQLWVTDVTEHPRRWARPRPVTAPASGGKLQQLVADLRVDIRVALRWTVHAVART